MVSAGFLISAPAGAANETPARIDLSHPKVFCTKQPKDKWLPAAEMRRIAEARGYKITTFKITNDSCYEIYGFKDGTIIEAYFDPVTATLVKQNIPK